MVDQLPSTIVKAMPSYRKLEKLLGQFREAMAEIPEDMNLLKRLTLSDGARFFVAYKTIREELEAIGKEFEETYSEFKTVTFPGMMEDDGQTNVPLTEGFRVGVSAKLYASIRGDAKREAYNWLRGNDLGELIVTTVNASTLSAAAKSRLETDFLELPDRYFNSMLQSNTSVTKTK